MAVLVQPLSPTISNRLSPRGVPSAACLGRAMQSPPVCFHPVSLHRGAGGMTAFRRRGIRCMWIVRRMVRLSVRAANVTRKVRNDTEDTYI